MPELRHSIMENQTIELSSNRKRIRELPSVPFLWEVWPGIAKKNWKPDAASAAPTLPPVKLIASVPFIWEEKPGKPLPLFPQQPPEPESQAPLVLLCLPAPPAYPQLQHDDSNSTDSGTSHCSNEDTGISETNLEVFGFETDDSFSSAPSLMANCRLPSSAICTAVPVQENTDTDSNNGPTEIPSSPVSETDSSTSSYATSTSSLVGSSFLECLFPLLPTNSGFVGKFGNTCPEESSQLPRDFDRDSNRNMVIRRPLTLGELIMMSRRRSYMIKAVQMRKQNLSMEKMRKRDYGCFSFRATIKFIEGIQWKKFQPRVKLL